MLKLQDFLSQNPFRKSLEISWKEGIPASFMQSLVDEYLIPFGLFLGATPSQIGLLVAIPSLFGSLCQFFSVRLVELIGSQLGFLARATFAQALILLALVLFPVLEFPNRIFALIVLIMMFRVLGNLIGTVWGGLTSSYLPPEERGRYFGFRAYVVGLAGLIGMVFGGFLLFFVGKISIAAGFVMLFLIASAARFFSSELMRRMQNVTHKKNPLDDFTFFMFLRRIRESNFVKFVIYVAAIMFATNLAAPYFTVYMLRDLHFSYLSYMAVHFAALVAGLISFPIWGKHADSVGNARILKTTSLLIPLIPLFWTFSSSIPYLFCVEIFSGFVWGGFNLCSLNFIYDAVSPGKKLRCLSYFTFISGIATFLGAGVGGFLAEHLPALKGSRILSLMLLSAGLRLLSHFIFSQKFHEVRANAKKMTGLEFFFTVVGVRPILRNREWNILSYLKKFPRSD